MLLLRSLIFNVFFSVVFVCAMVVALPILLASEEAVFKFWKNFSVVLGWITKMFAGISVNIEGEDKLNQRGVIYAMRHESTWETLVLIHYFEHPIFVMKKELFSIPIFGAMAKKSGAIPVDREDRVHALRIVLDRIKYYISQGRTVIIFPEGTRMPTGVFNPLRRGIALFYGVANCPVIPVIHNAGRFWPRHGFIKYPGVISMKVLPPILPGLPHDVFIQKLNNIFRREVENLVEE